MEKRSAQRHSAVQSPTKMDREKLFESLRSSSMSHKQGTAVDRLEERERAKVEARSLEAIRHPRRGGAITPTSSAREKKHTEVPTAAKSQTQVIRPPNRLSSSIDSLPSASKPHLSLTLPRNTGSTHGSKDQHLESGEPSMSHHRRPASEVYPEGGQIPSLPVTDGVGGVLEYPLSPEQWELDDVESRETGLSLSQPDHHFSARVSAGPSPSSSLSQSLTRSVDHGLNPLKHLSPLRQLSSPTSTSSGAHSSHQSAPSSDQRGTVASKSPGSSYTLPRTKKQSQAHSTPSSPITPPPLPSVPPPQGVAHVNQPTFVPLGRGRPVRKPPPAYPFPENESLAAEISDLHDQLILLSNQLLHEKADVYTRLHRAGELTHTHSLSLTHTHTHTHTLSLSLSHTHTHTHKLIQTNSHTHTFPSSAI